MPSGGIAARALTRREFAAVGAFAAAALLCGCTPVAPTGTLASNVAPSSGESVASAVLGDGLHLATGGQSGVYYELGQLLTRSYAGSPETGMTALVSNGAKANIDMVGAGAADFAFCQGDVVARALEGSGAFAESAAGAFSMVAALYDEKLQIVARDSGIRTVADLKGKRVSVGALDSGTCIVAFDVLGAYGLSEQDFTPAYLGFGDSADALENGWLDAAFFVAGVPTPAVSALFESETGVHLVALNDAHIADLGELSAHYGAAVVAPGAYPGQEKAVATIGARACLIAADSAPDDDVHALVSALFAAPDDGALATAFGKYGALDAAAASAFDLMPYHPGAARFYAELAASATPESDGTVE